jgi:hypothetical protein
VDRRVYRMILPSGSFLGREGEEIGYHTLVAFDVLGCKAGVVMHENGGEVTGDLLACVAAGILVIQTRRTVEPSDGRGAVAECYDAWNPPSSVVVGS